MRHERGSVAVVKEQRGLRAKIRIGLPKGGEDRVVERPRGAHGLRQVEKGRCAAFPHALVALLGADPGGQLAGDDRDDEVGGE
jgi:hypothetical protein